MTGMRGFVPSQNDKRPTVRHFARLDWKDDHWDRARNLEDKRWVGSTLAFGVYFNEIPVSKRSVCSVQLFVSCQVHREPQFQLVFFSDLEVDWRWWEEERRGRTMERDPVDVSITRLKCLRFVIIAPTSY